MRVRNCFVITSLFLALLAVSSAAQDMEKPAFKAAASAEFMGLPVLPSCMIFTVERGNPGNGASILLIKADSGCIVPWHWHSANEELMLVSGRGSVDMTDFPTHAMRAGDYVLLPAKHHHQFTCKSKCVMFDAIADTFDIHYVDKSGQEVPVDQALSAVSEKPAPGKPTQ